MILGLKLGRRLVAAVALNDDRFVFQDSRYVRSPRTALEPVFERYLRHVFEQVKPAAVYYYAPIAAKTVTELLIKQLTAVSGAFGIPVKPLTRLEVFGSFGVLPIRTRHELCEQITAFWPALREAKVQRQEVLAEAAATALVGDLHQGWPPV